MTTLKRLKQLKELSLSEWQLLTQSMLLLPAIALSLRINGLKRTQDMLAKQLPEDSRTSIPESGQLRHAQSVARMVFIAANHGLFRTNCLKISLATWWLLERAGISTKLVIGVNKNEELFNAHAWVEYQGKAFDQNTDIREQFSAFDSH